MSDQNQNVTCVRTGCFHSTAWHRQVSKGGKLHHCHFTGCQCEEFLATRESMPSDIERARMLGFPPTDEQIVGRLKFDDEQAAIAKRSESKPAHQYGSHPMNCPCKLCKEYTQVVQQDQRDERKQIYVAHVDAIPDLTLQPHEICDEVSSADVVQMWTALKYKHVETVKVLAAALEQLQGHGITWADGTPMSYESVVARLTK